MKKTISILASLIVIILLTTTQSAFAKEKVSFENAIIVPDDFIERMATYNNDDNSWFVYEEEICSAYFPSYNNGEISIAGVKGDLKASPSNMYGTGLEYNIRITVLDPKAQTYQDSIVLDHTIKYYQEQFGSIIMGTFGDEVMYGGVDIENNRMLSISVFSNTSAVEIMVSIAGIPKDIPKEEILRLVTDESYANSQGYTMIR